MCIKLKKKHANINRIIDLHGEPIQAEQDMREIFKKACKFLYMKGIVSRPWTKIPTRAATKRVHRTEIFDLVIYLIAQSKGIEQKG